MEKKLKQEEEAHIRLLLSSKPKTDDEPTKKWIDEQVRLLFKKYRTAKKLF